MRSRNPNTASQAQLRRLGYAPKIYHFARFLTRKDTGENRVSALCYSSPKAIDLSRGQSWTTRPEGVTCSRCTRALAERAGSEGR